ncbi:Myblike DNAbinding domain-containing protein [Mortierella sp. GBA35]|nr:Myblike DNAbinding domain-containing protein [Mortierella sp. GBA35]
MPLPEQTVGAGRKVRTLRRSQPSTGEWTDEEDIELYRLVKKGVNTFEIYARHFRHRSFGAVTKRVSAALKVRHLQEQQAKHGVLPGEDDVAKSVAGEEGVIPLRALYMKLRKAEAERRGADMSDNAILRLQLGRKDTPRKGVWDPKEDELLKRLVDKYSYLPAPVLWHKVAGGKIGDNLLLRNGRACSRRWRQLYPTSLAKTGCWTKEEERLLQEAISEQLEGKYQVALDVLSDKYAGEGMSPGEWRRNLQQLPSQSGLPILKQGSRRLNALNWIAIEEKVKSRADLDCRHHFLEVYHNGKRGPMSKEEMERLREGLELFGDEESWKLAEHVGTRSTAQICDALRYMRKKARQEAGKAEKEVTSGKKQ